MTKIKALVCAFAVMTALASCRDNSVSSVQESSEAVTETSAVTEEETEAETEAEPDTESETEPQTVPAQEVGYEGMEAVYADSINDGEYDITVDSSSSMFNIDSCKLTVENGEMTAVMTMSGTGYEYLFMGTADEAENADESRYISYEEKDGAHTFTVPVEALDKKIACAAFSKRKEVWYDRDLVFRADSLPFDALAEGSIDTAETLGLEDGVYAFDVTLEGGSGKATVQSPAKVTVEGGKATAELVWSSNKYDYMVVDGEKYLPVSTEEFSVFEIPVTGFGYKMPVSADTTAMSTPHEISYTLFFDTASQSPWEE